MGEMEDDKLMFKAEINGEEVFSAEQTKPYEGAAVVYVGDSHYDAFPGTIRNLVINLGGNTLSTEARIESMIEKRDDGFSCTNCGYTSKKPSHMREQVEKHIAGLEYPCSSCNKI